MKVILRLPQELINIIAIIGQMKTLVFTSLLSNHNIGPNFIKEKLTGEN